MHYQDPRLGKVSVTGSLKKNVLSTLWCFTGLTIKNPPLTKLLCLKIAQSSAVLQHVLFVHTGGSLVPGLQWKRIEIFTSSVAVTVSGGVICLFREFCLLFPQPLEELTGPRHFLLHPHPLSPKIHLDGAFTNCSSQRCHPGGWCYTDILSACKYYMRMHISYSLNFASI